MVRASGGRGACCTRVGNRSTTHDMSHVEHATRSPRNLREELEWKMDDKASGKVRPSTFNVDLPMPVFRD